MLGSLTRRGAAFAIAALTGALLGIEAGDPLFGLQVLRSLPKPDLVPFFPPLGTKEIRTADLDGDGDLDIAYLAKRLDRVGWLESSGGAAPSFTDHLVTGAFGHSNPLNESRGLAIADVDGDGHQDLLVGLRRSVRWLQSDGATPPSFTNHEIATGLLPGSLEVVDLDGDDDLDVLVGGFTVFADSFWLEQHAGVGSGWTRHAIAVGGQRLRPGDLDGDGDPDFASASRWFENDGGSPPGFVSQTLSQPAQGGSDVQVADLNGDQRLDVVSTTLWYENLGTVPLTFTVHTITSGFGDEPVAVDVADLDGDLDLDVAVVSQADGALSWFENLGGGASWGPRRISRSVDGALAVAAADVDDDGRVDLLSGSGAGEELNWHRNRGTTLNLPLTLRFDQFAESMVEPLPTFSGVGVATVDGSGGFSMVGGLLGTQTVTTPPASPFDIFAAQLAVTLGTGSYQPGQGADVRIAGPLRYCVLEASFPDCTVALRFPLSRGGAAAGVGGILTISGGSNRFSVVGAPWTIGTVSVTDATANGARMTFTGAGFAHGPASFTSSATASGIVQLVTPFRLLTRLDAPRDREGMIARLTLHFAPEPGPALLLATGAIVLGWLGLRRRR